MTTLLPRAGEPRAPSSFAPSSFALSSRAPQTAADTLATPCDAPCPRARAHARLVSDLCADDTIRAVLAVARYLVAAKATGETDCLEAAFVEAEAAFPPVRAGLVVGAVGGLVRAGEAALGRPLVMLPASCCRAGPDEIAFVEILTAARAGTHERETRLGRAAGALAAILEITGAEA